MKKDLLLIENEQLSVSSIELNDSVFASKISDGSIYHAIRNHLANKRVGTVGKKTRSMVAGSKKKPWRQKGTGRARAGTKQSPVWVGGGLALAPQARDYSYTLPKKIRHAALRSVLSMKVLDSSLLVVKDFTCESGKTQDMIRILDVVLADVTQKKVLLILPSYIGKKQIPQERLSLVVEKKLRRKLASPLMRATWNIPWLKTMYANQLNVVDIFYAKQVIVFESAINEIVENWSEK